MCHYFASEIPRPGNHIDSLSNMEHDYLFLSLPGATCVLAPKFSASRFWADCRQHGVTVIQYVGEVLRYLCNVPEVRLWDWGPKCIPRHTTLHNFPDKCDSEVEHRPSVCETRHQRQKDPHLRVSSKVTSWLHKRAELAWATLRLCLKKKSHMVNSTFHVIFYWVLWWLVTWAGMS